jgi:hypothetical protein
MDKNEIDTKIEVLRALNDLEQKYPKGHITFMARDNTNPKLFDCSDCNLTGQGAYEQSPERWRGLQEPEMLEVCRNFKAAEIYE